ncbi:MAG: hypothetical protein HKM07_08310 [Chlamydiae bacterium]|jgi:protein arginine kinase activator|nr:hypothetical protein [Chlamydiota bacterium]
MADRPVECSHCKKPQKVIYKEIVDDTIVCYEMCADCPVLEQKLHGQTMQEEKKAGTATAEPGLYCDKCHTTLSSIKMGNYLGCSECYVVFADTIASELKSLGKIAAHGKSAPFAKKSIPTHIGKSPEKPADITLSSRLSSLNEALNDALKKENYEQAAWLRDQIKALTDKPDESKS